MNAQVVHTAVACRAVKQQILSYPCRSSCGCKKRAYKRPSTSLRSKQADDDAAETVQGPVVNALTAIGLFGTVAVTGASLCGIKVFNMFQWNTDDILLALKINLPLLLAEALLFIPSYRIPASFSVKCCQDAYTSKATAEHFPSSSSSGIQGQQQQQQQQQQRLVDMAAVKSATIRSADSWWLMLSLYRSVLRRPSSDQLPKQVSACLMVARETSKELLQRGFLLTALAGWLTDRFYEAGLEDTVNLDPSGLVLSLPQLGFWVGSFVVTLVFSPAAFVAAQEGAESVSGSLLLRTQVGQQALLAAAGHSSSSSSSSSSSGHFAPLQQQNDAAAAAEEEEVEKLQEQQSSQEEVRESEDDELVLDPDVLEYRLFKVTEECVDSAAVKAAYGMTLAKEFARIVLANVSFVATNGNLAATWSCSLLLNGLLLVYGVLPGQQQQQQRASKQTS